ncbi:MAG TPA: glycosyltransferase family 39 protein [bacterium]|nr:glycosyltransferase family 39 protein [bacterium]HOL46625.1 glycosyltransferase family 39 protein [bacterium]HPQ17804.1 glycosyltransferase family 39 protein [bacterium]
MSINFKKFILLSFLFLFLCVIAFYVRVYKIAIFPGFNGDEFWYANKAYYIEKTSLLKIFFGMKNYTGALVPGIIYFFNKIFGFNYIACRLASVFFGTFLVALTFLFAIKYFDFTTALFSTLYSSFSFFLIAYSRIATQHIWVPFFLIIASFLLFEFIKKKKIYYLIGLVIFIGFSIQLLPITILFLLFAFFCLLSDFKKFKKIISFKLIIFFVIFFIIATSSIFIYTSKEVIRIFALNISYIKNYKILFILKIFIFRFIEYFNVFVLTFAGLRSLNYFCGVQPIFFNFILFLHIIFLFPVFYLIKSKNKFDKLLWFYIIFHLLAVPLFLEFFNKNMHLPHLGEERYLIIFYPFLFIALYRTYLLILKNKTFLRISIFVFFILIQIIFYRFYYVKIFLKSGGAKNLERLDHYIYSINKRPVIYEAAKYLRNNWYNDFNNFVLIVPSFWLYQPIKYLTKEEFNNLFFWPEKRIPEIWITDNNFLPYEYATIGLNNFIEKFKNKKIYFLCWNNNEKNRYLKRLEEINKKYILEKEFEKRDGEVILDLYKLE